MGAFAEAFLGFVGFLALLVLLAYFLAAPQVTASLLVFVSLLCFSASLIRASRTVVHSIGKLSDDSRTKP